jgi:hypothetical protein
LLGEKDLPDLIDPQIFAYLLDRASTPSTLWSETTRQVRHFSFLLTHDASALEMRAVLACWLI